MMPWLRVLVTCVVVSVSQAEDVIRTNVTMSGMVCGPDQTGIAVYPADSSRKYPVISYAHGMTLGGPKLESAYTNLWNLLASAGYVIIAPKAGWFNYCDEQYEDQLHALVWARNSTELKDRIDFRMPAAIAGHSMGGHATLRSASQAEKVKELNIGAAVTQHPSVIVGGCKSCKSVVPIMFTTGTDDWWAPPTFVRYEYNKPTNVSKAFVDFTGVGHSDPSGSDMQGHYVLDWLNCFVKGNSTACKLAQCKEPQQSIPTFECETQQMPSVDVIV